MLLSLTFCPEQSWILPRIDVCFLASNRKQHTSPLILSCLVGLLLWIRFLVCWHPDLYDYRGASGCWLLRTVTVYAPWSSTSTTWRTTRSWRSTSRPVSVRTSLWRLLHSLISLPLSHPFPICLSFSLIGCSFSSSFLSSPFEPQPLPRCLRPLEISLALSLPLMRSRPVALSLSFSLSLPLLHFHSRDLVHPNPVCSQLHWSRRCCFISKVRPSHFTVPLQNSWIYRTTSCIVRGILYQF